MSSEQYVKAESTGNDPFGFSPTKPEKASEERNHSIYTIYGLKASLFHSLPPVSLSLSLPKQPLVFWPVTFSPLTYPLFCLYKHSNPFQESYTQPNFSIKLFSCFLLSRASLFLLLFWGNKDDKGNRRRKCHS